MGRRNQDVTFPARSKRVWRIAAYIRLSREDGNDVSNSVTNQRERILAHLLAFEGEYVLEGIYIDDGCTGTDVNRAGFQRMLQHIREHRINCVVVKDLSRLSRNVADATYHLENIFVEYDIRFISLELPQLDSHLHPEQMNSILVPLQNVLNDDFCRQTSIKVRGALNAMRRQGKFIGAFAPYGYRKDSTDRHRLTIDTDAAAVVHDIFSQYVHGGMSKAGIAKRLNGLGIPSPSAYKGRQGLAYRNPHSATSDGLWTPKTIAGILQNEVYLGHMVQGRYRIKSYKVHQQALTPREEWFRVENTHEPVVGEGLFDAAQELGQSDTRAAPGSRTLHVLSGFVRCADCNKAMVRSQGGSATKYAYYQCRTYRDKSKAACTKHSIRADSLEEAVLHALRAQISLVASPEGIVAEALKASERFDASARLNGLLASKRKELATAIAIRDALYGDWKLGELTGADYQRLKGRYGAEADALNRSISALEEELSAAVQRAERERTDLEEMMRFGYSKLTRGMLVDLVDAIYVHDNGAVEIAFKFRDQHEAILSRADCAPQGEPRGSASS